MDIDKLILYFLNGFTKKNDILDAFWVFLAQYVIFIFGLILIYVALKDRKIFLKLMIATIITVIIVAFIKKIWFIPRPFLGEKINLLIEHRVDSAFPSKHAAVACVVAFGVFLENKKLGIWLLFLAFLVALSRVVVGVHYPSDIFAGALIGIGIAGITHKLFLIRSRKQATAK